MSVIGIVTPPSLGHIYPTLSVGEALIDRGHRVYWLCHIRFIASMLPEGGELLYVGDGSPDVPERLDSNPYGMQSLWSLYEEALVPINIDLYKQIDHCHRKMQFDLLINDHQAFCGALFSHNNGLPHVTSVTAPATIDPSPDFPEVHRFEKEQVLKCQRALGYEGDVPLAWEAPLTLVYNTQAFLNKTDFPDSYQFIGPSISRRREWDIDVSGIERKKGRNPVVLVSLGSVLNREPSFVDLVVRAFENQNVTVVLVSDPALRETWPENFIVYSYIPQLKVLTLVDAVICHAGHNTVCEALSRGLPLVTLPVAFDQSYVATKIAESGCGIRLKYRRVKAEHLRDAIFRVINDPQYRKAAVRIQRSFERAGGERRAADLIENLLETKPEPPSSQMPEVCSNG